MLCHVALVRTDVSEKLSASIIRVKRIGELGTLTRTSNRSELQISSQLLRNVGSYKSHTAYHPRRRHSSDAFLLHLITEHNMNILAGEHMFGCHTYF
jgi:hypothetical protein